MTWVLQDFYLDSLTIVVDLSSASQMGNDISRRARCSFGIEFRIALDLGEQGCGREGDEVGVTKEGQSASVREGEDDVRDPGCDISDTACRTVEDEPFALTSSSVSSAGNMLSAPSHPELQPLACSPIVSSPIDLPYRFKFGNFFPRNLSSSSLRAKSLQIRFRLSPPNGISKLEASVSK